MTNLYPASAASLGCAASPVMSTVIQPSYLMSTRTLAMASKSTAPRPNWGALPRRELVMSERRFAPETSRKRTERKRDWFDLAAAQQRVTNYLGSLLQLEPAEQTFLDAFQGGKWVPGLIFDGEQLDRIAQHPMAQWKLSN